MVFYPIHFPQHRMHHHFAMKLRILRYLTALLSLYGLLQSSALANLPGGGTGAGPDVTLNDNGSTVAISNGIVSIVCNKSGGNINQINYTYNNGSGTKTTQLLSGGNNGGQLYWENSTSEALTFSYSVVVNPANTGGNYAEIALFTTSVANDTLEVHYSLLRGSTGFYVTAIYAHRSIDGTFGMGECRDNIYAGSIFNWMSVDATRNRLMEVSGGSAISVLGAPVEVSLWTNGIYAGQYEDKYKYSADLGLQRVWGWSSVGTGGLNVGLWNILASSEYYNGGPLKLELMEHIGTTVLNMLNGGHYGMGQDGNFAAGEVWNKVYGPYFIYCNNVTNTLTGTNQPAQALYADAQAQAQAEVSAWPYSWFTNANFTPASNRGNVTGQFVINDSGNPNASAAGLWVGLIQQPSTTGNIYDFQAWMKPYQFWTKTDTNGNFTLTNVIAGGGYTLYAFGPGSADTFMSQSQSGGSPPLIVDVPASPFAVTVTGGATNNLGTVTWTPARVGATVFELGYPDHTGHKFRHGDDWWVGDIGPSSSAPSPIWSKWLEFPFDFPSGLNYVVGQNRWSTDWNFMQPVVTDSSGNYNNSSSTITFNLASTPTNGAQASFYLALASDYRAAIIITVNGVNLGGAGGISATPIGSIPSTGYIPANDNSDTSIREGGNAMFSDERITFPASMLHAGNNTINIGIRQVGGSYFADHAMYDYLRLEITGYVPPPPASVTAYAGNNCNLVTWPVTPGATSYNIYSTTTSGSGYTLVASGVNGPICGSGSNNAAYLDTTAVNGTTYYYVVQSVNPTDTSTNSPESPGATPSGSLSTSAPATPTGLIVASTGHQSVTLNWNASPGANCYSVWRSVLVNTGGGSSNTLSTIILNNAVTGASFTDAAVTDGSIYNYFVTATSAGGTSGNSLPAVAVPLPAPPASAPSGLSGIFVQTTNIFLSWSPVSGAVGYLISRATSPSGPFTFVMSVTETSYLDAALNPATTYYYQVQAMNVAGVSANASTSIAPVPTAPTSLSAIPGNAQVTLNWPPVPAAAGYFIYGGTDSNNLAPIVGGYVGTSYTNTGLINGTTYYYEVAGTNSGGLGPFSPMASATPDVNIVILPRLLTWKGDGTANIWDTAATPNWQTNGVATIFFNGDTASFDNTGSASPSISLSVAVQAGLVIVSNTTAKNYTFNGSGSITGTNLLVKTGPGTLTLSEVNTYTGGTTVSNGLITFSSGVTIPPAGTLRLMNTGAVTVVTANSLPNTQVNGTNAITGNGNSGTGAATLDVEGRLNLFVSGGSKVFDLTGPLSGPGTLALGTAAMTLRFNGTTGYSNTLFNLGTGTSVASVRNGGSSIAMGGLSGGTGTILAGASSSGQTVTFTIGSAGPTTEFDGLLENGGFSGSPAVVLIKTGPNTLTLSNANAYSGGTIIRGGILQVNNRTGTGTGAGAVTVNNGGTLAGIGILSGAVTVQSGGVLNPGIPLGRLTISNNLTLTAGSTSLFQIQHSPLTNSSVTLTGTLVEGGMLIVSKIGANPLASGDSFQLFNAANYSGAFDSLVLPPLTGNLVWNTNVLTASGLLTIVTHSSPVISGVQFQNGSLVLTGSGAPASWPYYVLASTNAALPLSQWTPIATNQTDATGNFNVTNTVDPTLPQNFLILQLP